jgi:hypothetical protein
MSTSTNPANLTANEEPLRFNLTAHRIIMDKCHTLKREHIGRNMTALVEDLLMITGRELLGDRRTQRADERELRVVNGFTVDNIENEYRNAPDQYVAWWDRQGATQVTDWLGDPIWHRDAPESYGQPVPQSTEELLTLLKGWGRIPDRIQDLAAPEDELETEPQEVYSWHSVSEELADELVKAGKPVLRAGDGLTFWGRTTTGQSIVDDEVIQRLAEQWYTEAPQREPTYIRKPESR